MLPIIGLLSTLGGITITVYGWLKAVLPYLIVIAIEFIGITVVTYVGIDLVVSWVWLWFDTFFGYVDVLVYGDFDFGLVFVQLIDSLDLRQLIQFWISVHVASFSILAQMKSMSFFSNFKKK